ncbi:uncharacterized protein N7477_006380 [Penicillium maclennaniae]|uniref:uncharacterized protein n=1 Tax=Penicillium maclennaniae TaxID=1343394 RepID=UPI00254223AF|nr:uncharacterized protein N7477_006380 [Penicillium maclennaniae]KAJ5667810.1 hypothetical protein N7477_006380 [Penicillium maclennaniae]
MLVKSLVVALAAVGAAVAQRPTNESICDYYTTALLKTNNATNQYTLLTLLVNTAVIGNYTQPNVGVSVPGILNPNGTYNGTKVNLVPYFDGGLASSNNGGKMGVAKNFLDGGGAAPLMKNMPANDMSSNQYKLMTHLYQFFGSLLGCSGVGMTGFSAYAGEGSMYQVHKFMVLDPYQMGYFIEQVGLAAASFGVAESDITVVATALTSLFDYRCAPKTTVINTQGAQYQSICTDEMCPLAMNSTCAAQPVMLQPLVANQTLAAGEGRNSSESASATGSSSTSTSTSGSTSSTPSAAGAAQYQPGLMAVLSAVLAFFAL